MGWRFVRQPNGLFARFSDVVDDFTHSDMTEAECLDCCRVEHGMTETEARYKVGSATADLPLATPLVFGNNVMPWGHEAKWDGLDRFRDAIGTVRVIHGARAARTREDQLSRPRK